MNFRTLLSSSSMIEQTCGRVTEAGFPPIDLEKECLGGNRCVLYNEVYGRLVYRTESCRESFFVIVMVPPGEGSDSLTLQADYVEGVSCKSINAGVHASYNDFGSKEVMCGK